MRIANDPTARLLVLSVMISATVLAAAVCYLISM